MNTLTPPETSNSTVINNFGKWMAAYGLFLCAMGLAGYLSNPEKAKTALMSGGAFGGIAIILGLLAQRGFAWTRGAGLALSTLLSGVFIWRASVSWMAVASGQSAKLIAAVLITAMGLASIAMMVKSIRALKSNATPTQGPLDKIFPKSNI